MNNNLSLLKSVSLFSGIAENEIDGMLDCLEAKSVDFKKGAYIFRVGDSADSIGLMLSGSALVLQEDFWGNRNIMSQVSEGQIFAEVFACSQSFALNVSVVTETPCSIMFLNVKRILTRCPSNCSHHNRLIRNLVSDLANKNMRFNEKLTHMSQRTTREKILSYLSAEAKRNNGSRFDIPFSRQQLADYLSVERSGLSTELGKMRDEGLLSFVKNHFVLKQV